MIRWSAMLGALEALACGTTAIVDHHESPNAIEGSLDVIAAACTEAGVRVVCAYGVTDRHGGGARQHRRRRFLAAGSARLVGIATFTMRRRHPRGGRARKRFGVGVHIHVCEGPGCRLTPARPHATSRWLLPQCALPPAHGLAGTSCTTRSRTSTIRWAPREPGAVLSRWR